MRRGALYCDWRRTAGLIACLTATGNSIAASPESPALAQLVYPEGQTAYAINDNIIVRLEDTWAIEGGTWRLELDGIDVTAVAQRSAANELTLRPAKQMQPGQHQLRLVVEPPIGGLIEVGQWAVQMFAPDPFIDASLDYALDTQGNWTVYNSDDLDGAREHGGDASLYLNTQVDVGKQALEARANFFANSEADRWGQDDIELGDFLLQGGNDALQLRAGHFAVAPVGGHAVTDLAYDGANRRGLSVSTRVPGTSATVTAFAQGSEPVNGFRDGFAISDPDQRISGGVLRWTPLDDPSRHLGLTLGYYEGVGLSGGTSVYNSDLETYTYSPGIDGKAGSAMLDSRWFSGALSFRAEYARSERDFPLLLGLQLDPVSDDAQRYALSYQSIDGVQIGEHTLYGHLTMEYQRLGTAYRSVAAPSGLADIAEQRVSTGLQYATVSLDLNAARSEDNVNDGPLPTTRSESLGAQLNWSPDFNPDRLPAIFQQPSLSVGVGKDRRRTVKLPEPIEFSFPSDDESRSVTTSLSFSQPLGGWGASYSRATSTDRTGQSQNFRSDTGSLDANFYFGDRLTLFAQLSTDLSRQLQLTSSPDADFAFFYPASATRSESASLTLQWQVLREHWQISMGYATNHSNATDDSYESRGQQVDFSSTWSVWRFSIFLRGSYQHATDRSLIIPFEDADGMPSAPEYNRSRRESYQALAGFSLSFSGV